MSRFIKVYAKVNLFLRVLNRRSDGYHNILSLMAHINLADLLKLEYADVHDNPEDLHVEVVNVGGTFSEILEDLDTQDNLIAKVVSRAASEAGIGGRFRFLLEKNIPAGAGLGGGSADAAGALKLLEPYLKLEKKSLMSVAARTGADVPFHLFHGFALCEGIGEKVEVLEDKLNSRIVICNDGTHVDTGAAYRMLNRESTGPDSSKEIILQKDQLRNAVKRGDIEALKHIAVNDFESVVFKEYNNIAFIKEKVEKAGADFAIMTGSGSTVIGLFSDNDSAAQAAERLNKSIKHVFIADFA